MGRHSREPCACASEVVGRHRVAFRGSLLIVAVWTLFFLTALAVALSAYVQRGTSAAARLKARMLATALARAGIAQAAAELTLNTNEWDSLDENWSQANTLFKDVRIEGGAFRVWYTNTTDTGVVHTNYGLIDEDRRINIAIPLRNEDVLRSLFVLIGNVPEPRASEIVAAIMDWKDPDGDERPGGAEVGYYQSQDPPYEPRNAPFELVEELLLVRGMTRDLYDRVSGSITVYGQGMVNINTASRDVLLVLAHSRGTPLEVAASLADKIESYRDKGMNFRQGGRFEVVRDAIIKALARAEGLSPEEQEAMARMVNGGLVTIRSSAFRAVSGGRVDNRSDHDRVIEAVLHGADGSIAFWREN